MKCPKYNFTQSKVVDSKHTDELNAIRKRRKYENCGTCFTTFEHIEASQLIVMKKGGTREQFPKEKIFNGLMRSCEKRPVGYQQPKDITDEVGWQSRDESRTEVSSWDIGKHVVSLLMHIDQVSYVRFALVYKKFRDANQLLASVQRILSGDRRSDT